jgi:hypothetical protein
MSTLAIPVAFNDDFFIMLSYFLYFSFLEAYSKFEK